MDRAERLWHRHQSGNTGRCKSSGSFGDFGDGLRSMDSKFEHSSRQLGELSRSITASQSALLDVQRQVQLQFAALCELKTMADRERSALAELQTSMRQERARAEELERCAQAAHVKMRQTQAMELASRAALSFYTQQLDAVTSKLESIAPKLSPELSPGLSSELSPELWSDRTQQQPSSSAALMVS